jgi:hypothetical protein
VAAVLLIGEQIKALDESWDIGRSSSMNTENETGQLPQKVQPYSYVEDYSYSMAPQLHLLPMT